MKQFKVNNKKVKIAGADVEIKRLTPAIQDDVKAVYEAFGGQSFSVELAIQVATMPELKKCVCYLTDITEEDYDNLGYDIIAEVVAHVVKENIGFFSQTTQKVTEIMALQTGQS